MCDSGLRSRHLSSLFLKTDLHSLWPGAVIKGKVSSVSTNGHNLCFNFDLSIICHVLIDCVSCGVLWLLLSVLEFLLIVNFINIYV